VSLHVIYITTADGIRFAFAFLVEPEEGELPEDLPPGIAIEFVGQQELQA
jgi:hypothetical protein